MRSIIRDYLLSPLRPGDGGCPVCEKLNGYLHINDRGDECFPPEASLLVPPNDKLKHQYSEEELRKCPECGKYYAYREWSPGGSDDAMVTTAHESINRISFLEAHIILRESESVIENFLRSSPLIWQESYNVHQDGSGIELNSLKSHAAEILDEGIKFIESRAASKMNVYRDEAFTAEGEAAWIISDYLMTSPDRLTPGQFERYIMIAADERDTIRESIAGGLTLGIYKLNGDIELLKMAREIASGLPHNRERTKLINAIDSILEPGIKWRDFLSLENPVHDEALKLHIEKLPGITVLRFVPGGVTESILDFEYMGFTFSGDNSAGHWEFSVRGECPEEILDQLSVYLKK